MFNSNQKPTRTLIIMRKGSENKTEHFYRIMVHHTSSSVWSSDLCISRTDTSKQNVKRIECLP